MHYTVAQTERSALHWLLVEGVLLLWGERTVARYQSDAAPLSQAALQH